MKTQNIKNLLSEYAKVQKFAPAAASQPTDDLWDEIARLNEMRDSREKQAKKIVAPRRSPGNY